MRIFDYGMSTATTVVLSSFTYFVLYIDFINDFIHMNMVVGIH